LLWGRNSVRDESDAAEVKRNEKLATGKKSRPDVTGRDVHGAL